MGKRLRTLFLTRKWPPAVGGMETYSVELTTELGKLVDLDVRKLPGNKGGRPPSLVALAFFFLAGSVFLLRARNRYDVVASVRGRRGAAPHGLSDAAGASGQRLGAA